MKDDRIYLLHIRDAINRIEEYTKINEKKFFSDSKTQDAVIRNFEIIGEAVKNISSRLKKKHKDIPWKQIAGMRDKMIHEYFGVNLELVWNVVEKDIPGLKHKIVQILETKG